MIRVTSAKVRWSLCGFAARILGAWLLLAAPQALSQDSALDVPLAYDRAVQALDSGNFDAGLTALEPVLVKHAADGLEMFGPVFGHFFYLKGVLLIRKGAYPEAIPALKTCYEKYSNDSLKLQKGKPSEAKLPNRFRYQALSQWASCHLMLKQHTDAAGLYEKLLAEATDDPEVNRGEVQINLAICYLNLPDKMDKGRDFLLEQLKSTAWTGRMKRRIFLSLATEWTPGAPLAEVAPILADVAPLLREASALEKMNELNPAFANVAALAIQGGDPLRALAWYHLMGSPDEGARDFLRQHQILKARQLAPSQEPQRQAALKKLEENAAAYRAQLAPMLLGIGAAHIQIKSYAGSRAAYARLERMDPGMKDRPLVLHNLVVCSVNLNTWQDVITFGEKFFDEFPEHELRPAVARLMVEVLFIEQKYQEAYDVARETRDRFKAGDAMRDIPDFVLGASAYHLEKYEEAARELELYVSGYPQGQRLEPARFYLASTKVKLQQWPEAADLFDKFLADYPQSQLRPGALHLASLSHLIAGNLDRAEVCLSELQSKYPDSPEIPASYNVLGDLLTARESDYETVAPAYVKARDLVEKDGRGDAGVAAYALRQLIAAASNEQAWDAAAEFFDDFRKGYSDSSWNADAVIAALDALVKTERRDEGRDLLEALVNASAAEGPSPALDELVGSYVDFIRSNWATPEALECFEKFPALSKPPPPALESWLITAGLETLEKADPKGNADAVRKAYIRLTALYELNETEISNYSLVKLARWTLEDRKKEDVARKIYDFILKERPYGAAMGFALIEKAKIDAASKDPVIRLNALDTFRDAIARIDDSSMHEEAVLGIARMFTEDKKYPEAQVEWEKYLADRTWTRARAEANYSYALCLDMQGKKAEALKVYVSVYANFAGHLDWSTRAYLRTAAILKERGRDVDALKVLQDMLKRMGHHDHRGVVKGKEIFIRWRDAYVAAQQQK